MISSFSGLRVAPTVKLSDGKGIGTILRLRFLRNNFSNSNVLKNLQLWHLRGIDRIRVRFGTLSRAGTGDRADTRRYHCKLDFGLFSRFFTSNYKIQWVLQIRELQIRENSFIWFEIAKMTNKGILNLPLFDPKLSEKVKNSLIISSKNLLSLTTKLIRGIISR